MKQRIVFQGLLRVGIASLALCVNDAVLAHAQLLVEGATPPRYDTASLKNTAPCGNEASYASTKTNRTSIFLSGETITVEWKETVNHSGLFYLDFSTNGINGPYAGESTLTDSNDASITSWSMSYTLPSATCTDCILRMRQDMGNQNISGHYFSCADVILVSGEDQTAPSNTTNVMAVVNGVDVDLSWTNPADPDYRSTLVVRSSTSLSAAPQVRKDYVEGDLIGNGVVVYKGNTAQFSDSGLQGQTGYTYTVYSYDNAYNYNSGAVTTATTDTGGNTGGGDTGGGDTGGGDTGGGDTGGGNTGGDTSNSTPGDDSGSGALVLWWLLPAIALRRWHRIFTRPVNT